MYSGSTINRRISPPIRPSTETARSESASLKREKGEPANSATVASRLLSASAA